MTTQQLDQNELARRWNERCTVKTFSPAVLGVGTIRVMGKSGDAPVAFPRITSLDVLNTLEPDERWAVEVAQAIVRQAPQEDRRVFAVDAPAAGSLPTPVPMTTFNPACESLIVVSAVRGG